MKIALISTCALATPPHKYGGTELVVAELAKGLLELGHQVTTFATGDSKVAGRLRYHFRTPIWPPNERAEGRHADHAWRAIAGALHDYDVVHLNHGAALPYPLLVSLPTVLTIHHARVAETIDHYRAFPDVAYVAISRRQAALLPELSIRRVVHHGLDPARYPAGAGKGGYVAFLGRFSAEKAPHLAIDAARAAGVPVRLGGTYHEVAADYYKRELEPRLRLPGVQACGELAHDAKVELLRGASAMLFPIEWEEPFGLVMIESMLVGTPVIGFRHGSAPEVIEEGVTGFLVDSAAEMAQRIAELSHFDRARCRERAQARWSALRMAREYAELYAEIARPSLRLPARPPTLRAQAGAGTAASVMIQQDPPYCSAPRPTKELDHAATVRAERS
jgi:glycosyltransferase involved in cell wall biosynthesis